MCVCVCGGGGRVLKYEIGIYLPRIFKNGGLNERPLTENAGRGGAFRAAPHGKNRRFVS